MAKISVRLQTKDERVSVFMVIVNENGSETSHAVRLAPDDYNRLAGGKIAEEELVRRSFEFLLKREPKESILPEFNLALISTYFPDYEREIADHL